MVHLYFYEFYYKFNCHLCTIKYIRVAVDVSASEGDHRLLYSSSSSVVIVVVVLSEKITCKIFSSRLTITLKYDVFICIVVGRWVYSIYYHTTNSISNQYPCSGTRGKPSRPDSQNSVLTFRVRYKRIFLNHFFLSPNFSSTHKLQSRRLTIIIVRMIIIY